MVKIYFSTTKARVVWFKVNYSARPTSLTSLGLGGVINTLTLEGLDKQTVKYKDIKIAMLDVSDEDILTLRLELCFKTYGAIILDLNTE